MDATTLDKRPKARQAPCARIGMIIPSVNSMSEPQFNRFAPPGLAVHVTRARVAGQWKRPLPAMADEIAALGKAARPTWRPISSSSTAPTPR